MSEGGGAGFRGGGESGGGSSVQPPRESILTRYFRNVYLFSPLSHSATEYALPLIPVPLRRMQYTREYCSEGEIQPPSRSVLSLLSPLSDIAIENPYPLSLLSDIAAGYPYPFSRGSVLFP